jgi:hypothetical protein
LKLFYNQKFNQKRLNEIYFNTTAKRKSNFTKEQRIIIRNIANQCPYTGGDAVYEARSMYRLIDDEVVFDDKKLCVVPVHTEKKQSITAIPIFKVFPNPASDYAQISYNSTDAITIQITDLSGRILSSKNYQASDNIIETSDLANGMYFISLLNEKNTIIQTQKLFISK